MMLRYVGPFGLMLALTAPAFGQTGVSIADIRVQAFLERSGRWSDDLSDAKEPFKNLPRKDGDLGEPAEALLVTLVFAGPKDTDVSRALARNMATVSVKQMKDGATESLVYRATGGFSFGESGLAHKALLLDGAVCAPIEVEVKVGRSRKAKRIDFRCDDPPPAEAAEAKRDAGGARRR